MKLIKYILFLSLTFFSLNTYGQNFVPLKNLIGDSISTNTTTTLQSIVDDINLGLETNSNFNIFDCGFYTYNSMMTQDPATGQYPADIFWDQMKSEALSQGGNYLLFGRAFDQKENKMRLRIDFRLDPESVLCYSNEAKQAIIDLIEQTKLELIEELAYQSSDPSNDAQSLMIQISDLLKVKSDKFCCGIFRSPTCTDQLDVADARISKDQVYYVLSRLKCIINSNCGTAGHIILDAEDDLRDVDFNFRSAFSVFQEYDYFDEVVEFGPIHLIESDTSSNQLFCNTSSIFVTDTTKYLYREKYDDEILVGVKEYDFGRFKLVLRSGVDFFDKLSMLKSSVSYKLPAIIKKLDEKDGLTKREINILKMIPDCELLTSFENDDPRIQLIKFLVDRYDGYITSYLNIFKLKHPQLVLDIYNSLEDKNGFFQACLVDKKMAWDLVDYNFIDKDVKDEFFTVFSNDYKDYIIAHPEILKDILQIPYDVDTFWGFKTANYEFEFSKFDTKSIKIVKPIPEENETKLGILDLVILTKVDIGSDVTFNNRWVPAILMARTTKEIEQDNFYHEIGITIDVASIALGGIGLVTKFAKLGKVAVTIYSIELAAETANFIISNTDLIKNDSTKALVSGLLTLVELATLAPSIADVLKPKIIDQADKVSKGLKTENLADVKEISKFVSRLLGRQKLIERLNVLGLQKLKNRIVELDDVLDAAVIEKYHYLTDDVLGYVNNFTGNKFNKFEYDITSPIKVTDSNNKISTRGDKLVFVLNSKPNTVNHWNLLDDYGVHKLVRGNFDYLKSIDEYFTKFPSRTSSDFVATANLFDNMEHYLNILPDIVNNSLVRGTKFDSFEEVSGFNGNFNHSEFSFYLWKAEKWLILENFFKSNNINDLLPPNKGFKSISKTETGSQLIDQKFDRYQGAGILKGKYASPVYSGEGIDDLIFTYDSRALKFNIIEGTQYFLFKINPSIPNNVKFDFGEIIPWFGKDGLGDQIESSVNFSEISDYIEILEVKTYTNGQWQ